MPPHVTRPGVGGSCYLAGSGDVNAMANIFLSIAGLVILSVIAGDLFIEERRRRRSLRAFFARREP